MLVYCDISNPLSDNTDFFFFCEARSQGEKIFNGVQYNKLCYFCTIVQLQLSSRDMSKSYAIWRQKVGLYKNINGDSTEDGHTVWFIALSNSYKMNETKTQVFSENITRLHHHFKSQFSEPLAFKFNYSVGASHMMSFKYSDAISSFLAQTIPVKISAAYR